MCTILIARDLHPSYPLLIVANRDEHLDRPATGPQVMAHNPTIFAGRDLLAGGTWMGVTEAGFFVGITNQPSSGGSDPALKSRGQLVLRALKTNDLQGVTRWLSALRVRQYNPFNLLFGTASALRVAYARPGQDHPTIETVPTGLHVLPNDTLNSAGFPKVARAKRLLRYTPPKRLFEAMQRVIADTSVPHRVPITPGSAISELPEPTRAALHALCVRMPPNSPMAYGTRSATAIALVHGGVARYRFAPGPPNTAAFTDRLGAWQS